jgi:transposase
MTDLHTAVRRLFYVQNVPIEVVAKRHNMTIQQIQNIISNPNQTAMKKATRSGGRPAIRNKKFNANVKKLLDKGLSQQEIADMFNCSPSTIGRAASGELPAPKKVKKSKVQVQTTNKDKPKVKVQSKKRGSTISLLWGAFTYTTS